MDQYNKTSENKIRGIVVGIHAKYMKKARSTITADCSIVDENKKICIATGRTNIAINIINSKKELVATVTVEWEISQALSIQKEN